MGQFNFTPVSGLAPKSKTSFNFEPLDESPDEAFDAIDQNEEKRIIESQLDAVETRDRPGPISGIKQSFNSGIKELKTLGSSINKTANYLQPALTEMVKEAALMSTVGFPTLSGEAERSRRLEETNKLATTVKEILPKLAKSSPEIMTEVVSGTLEAYGMERKPGAEAGITDPLNFAEETRGFDPDVVYKRLREAPLTTIGDWSVAGGMFKKLAKIASKAVVKGSAKTARRGAQASFESSLSKEAIDKATSGDKQFVKDMLKRMDGPDKEAAFSKEIHEMTRAKTPTIKDRLLDRRSSITQMSNADLDNPEFAATLGNRVKENLTKLKLNEQGKLKASLSAIGDQTIDTEYLFKGMATELNEQLLLSKTNLTKKGPSSSKLKKGFKNTSFENFINEVTGTTTVKELNEMRKRLDQSINFNDPKPSDKALLVARRHIDGYIKGLDGADEYTRQSALVSNRLQPFFDQQKKIEKAGGGEKFGKSFFKSHEEVDLLVKALKESDSIAAQSLRANIEMLDGWHTWNKMFSSNTKVVPEFYMGTPMTAAMKLTNQISSPIAKGITKAKLAAPAIGNIPSPGSALSGAAQASAVADIPLNDVPSALEKASNQNQQ